MFFWPWHKQTYKQTIYFYKTLPSVEGISSVTGKSHIPCPFSVFMAWMLSMSVNYRDSEYGCFQSLYFQFAVQVFTFVSGKDTSVSASALIPTFGTFVRLFWQRNGACFPQAFSTFLNTSVPLPAAWSGIWFEHIYRDSLAVSFVRETTVVDRRVYGFALVFYLLWNYSKCSTGLHDINVSWFDRSY